MYDEAQKAREENLRKKAEESSYIQLQGILSPDYKYLDARQIAHQLSFPSQSIPDQELAKQRKLKHKNLRFKTG